MGDDCDPTDGLGTFLHSLNCSGFKLFGIAFPLHVFLLVVGIITDKQGVQQIKARLMDSLARFYLNTS